MLRGSIAVALCASLIALALVVAIAPVAASVSSAATATHPSCKKIPPKFRGVDANNFKMHCTVCRIFGVKATAKEFHISSSNAVTVALRMAQKSYRPPFQQAVFEGCLRGFS